MRVLLKSGFKRPWAHAALLLLLLPLTVGMGGKPGPEVPVPDRDFTATVIDDQDISTPLAQASWEGETFFKADRGKGVVTISFEKVRKIVRIGEPANATVDFKIVLKDGQTVAVTFDGDVRLFGNTSYGTYRIFAKNIREVVFD
jgi:hypothetical protein